MPDEVSKVGPQGIDTFREIGNIGSGNAATSLAAILDMRISMSVPEVEVVPFSHIINILNGAENLVVGVLVNMSGDLNGYILMILEMHDAFEMSSIALRRKKPLPEVITPEMLDELDRSTITEIANILVGSYLSAICAMTSLSVTPSVPQLAIDMVGAIISIVLVEYGKIGDSVLFLKTQFSDLEKKLSGHFFLIPDFESYKILMRSLGL